MTYLLGYKVGQSDFPYVITLYGGLFLLYAYSIIMVRRHSFHWRDIIVLGVLLRFILIFSFPNLSDDIYRFIWDGRLMHLGIHPLSYTPSQIITEGLLHSDYLKELYPLLNSPDYFTIYPGFCQLIFYLSAMGENPILSSIIIKSGLFLAECGSIYFLYKILTINKWYKSNVIIYALNPLVIIEICGNVHFEGFMVFFLLGGIYFVLMERYALSGVMWSLSIASKLLPLMFLPLVLVYLYNKRVGWFSFLGSLVVSTLILFVPLFASLDVNHFLSSIDLYFQKFEFNASLYYVFRTIGQWITGYNQIAVIGPSLSIIAMLMILAYAFRYYINKWIDGERLVDMMLYSFLTYLLLSTTVHPWYLALPLCLCALRPRIWVMVWSFLILLSYSTYASPSFQQNYWLIALEYLVVGLVWNAEKKSRIKLN